MFLNYRDMTIRYINFQFLEILKNILKGLFLAKVHLNFLKEILKNIMICDFMANDFGNTSSYYRDIMEFKLSYYCTIPSNKNIIIMYIKLIIFSSFRFNLNNKIL